MSDDWTICPNCSEIDSLRNVTGTYLQIWTKEQNEEFEKYLWCVSCKKLVKEADIKYQHTDYNKEE